MAGLALALAVALPPGARALEVDEVPMPRVTVDGEFFVTFDYSERTPSAGGSDIIGAGANLDDSAVTLTLDKPLARGPAVGGVRLLLRLEHSAVEPLLHAFVAGAQYRFSLGAMPLRNTLVRFPTLREGDLLPYTHALNGSLGLAGESAQTLGDAAVLDLYFRPSPWRLALFGQRRAQTRWDATAGAFVADDEARANSGGVVLAYDVAKGLRYERIVRRLGILYDTQTLRRGDNTEGQLTAMLAGGTVGLNAEPEYPWELSFQALQSSGLDDRDTGGLPLRATTPDALPRERAQAAVVSLRFINRRYLMTRWQAALTVADKSFADIPQGSQQSVVAAFLWRLGPGFDMAAQAARTDYAPGLASIVGQRSETRYQLGLSMALEMRANSNVVDPDSILELEHRRGARGN